MSRLFTDKPNAESNEWQQTVGEPVKNWTPPIAIQDCFEAHSLQGSYAQLIPLELDHAEGLYKAFETADDSLWTYLPYGPFQNIEAFSETIHFLKELRGVSNFCYAIFDKKDDKQERPLGFSAYLRATPSAGSIEIGHLAFSPALQRNRIATEAIFLMIDLVFKLGYRRCEWKCNDLNLPSISAAQRFGFSYEGTFRNALVVKGRNRDTAWFSIIESEWPALRKAYLDWLDESNFDTKGLQISRLSNQTKLT